MIQLSLSMLFSDIEQIIIFQVATWCSDVTSNSDSVHIDDGK